MDTLLTRIIGVVTFRAQTYRQIAEDATATSTATAIVVLYACLAAFGRLWFPLHPLTAQSVVVIMVLVWAYPILTWMVRAWLSSLVARGVFHATTDTGRMLRALGFSEVWILPIASNFYPLGLSGTGGLLLVCALLIIVLLVIASIVLATREAAALRTDNAIVVSILVFALMLPLIGLFTLLSSWFPL